MLLHKQLRVCGRCHATDDTLYLGWSGAFAEFLTDSRTLGLRLYSDVPDEKLHLGRVAVYAGDMNTPLCVHSLREQHTDLHLVLPPSEGEQPVRVMKWSENAFGLVGLEAIELASGASMHPTPEKAHKVEFIGDSITCGYGVEAPPTDTFSTATENPSIAYAMLAASELDVDVSLVSWSGIGVLSSWVSADAAAPNQARLMQAVYPLQDPHLCEILGAPQMLHDFSADPADLVVVNLGTNDASWTRGLPDREQSFAQAYAGFLADVHSLRPDAAILCVLGTLSQGLCDTAARVVDALRAEHPEVRIAFHRLPLQRPEDSTGADGHPSKITQALTARELVPLMRSML